jgi:hypothetical protein
MKRAAKSTGIVERRKKSTEIMQTAGGFMTNRLKFNIVCPHNHDQIVAFSQEEFEVNPMF